MTGLLVSVRNAEEAKTALEGGADVIDVKEPWRGALGPADVQVWRDVNEVVGTRVPISAALGDLVDDSIVARAKQARGLRFVKAGLAHWNAEAPAKWSQLHKQLPTNVSLIPAIYADARCAGWRSLAEEIDVALELATEAKSPLLLIDTFNKSAGSLLDSASLVELQAIMRRAKTRNLALALAGSLDAKAIETLLPLAPAYLGVRAAACSGGRDGAIDLARVKTLAQIVRSGRQKAAS